MIRNLKPGEPIPDGEPRRYPNDSGYIRLRWKVGKGEYVECYEHRVDGDRVTTSPQVHHVNHDPSDNRPENLIPVTTAEHGRHHRVDDKTIAELYLAGQTTRTIAERLKLNPGTISRSLKRSGVPTRKESPHRLKIDRSEVARRYLAGKGLETIAEEMGCTTGPIVRCLDELGIKRRRPGRPVRTAEPRSSAVRYVVPATRLFDQEAS